MSRFIESIKVEDKKVYLIAEHQQRVNQTFAYFGKENPIELNQIYNNLNHNEKGLFKFKVIYDLNGNFRTQMIPYAMREVTHFQLVENNSCSYPFKFEDRSMLEQMATKAGTGEVIIVKDNHITDTSFSNILFRKGREWFTPTTYLLNGVQRQHLLRTKKIKQAEITLQNLNDYSHFQLINAMNTFDSSIIYPLNKIRNLPATHDLSD